MTLKDRLEMIRMDPICLREINVLNRVWAIIFYNTVSMDLPEGGYNTLYTLMLNRMSNASDVYDKLSSSDDEYYIANEILNIFCKKEDAIDELYKLVTRGLIIRK